MRDLPLQKVFIFTINLEQGTGFIWIHLKDSSVKVNVLFTEMTMLKTVYGASLRGKIQNGMVTDSLSILEVELNSTL